MGTLYHLEEDCFKRHQCLLFGHKFLCVPCRILLQQEICCVPAKEAVDDGQEVVPPPSVCSYCCHVPSRWATLYCHHYWHADFPLPLIVVINPSLLSVLDCCVSSSPCPASSLSFHLPPSAEEFPPTTTNQPTISRIKCQDVIVSSSFSFSLPSLLPLQTTMT